MGRERIRDATPLDAAPLLEIYAHYVQHTAISFEWEVPTLAIFRERMENTLRRYPYLVLERDESPLGYAYAGAFGGRAAYGWACETTIYLAPAAQKQGLGRKLYRALEERLKDMGILNLYACVAYPEIEDEYLTRNSAGFHAHLGFVRVGQFHQCGYKINRWYDMIWMEKLLGRHLPNQPPVHFAP